MNTLANVLFSLGMVGCFIYKNKAQEFAVLMVVAVILWGKFGNL